MQVVYIDVLFLINFCMDFLALWFCGSLLHLPRRLRPLLLAAALGGVYAATEAVLPGNPTVSLLVGAGTALLLCFTAYGRHCRAGLFATLCALFFGISGLFGGMITAFYTLLERFFRDRSDFYEALIGGEGRLAVFSALAMLVVTAVSLSRRLFAASAMARSAKVEIRDGGRTRMLSAMVDTGNTLHDPLSGKVCIVIDPHAVLGVLPEDVLSFSAGGDLDLERLLPKNRKRIRLVPTESVGGGRLLVGYLPDRIEVASSEGRGRRSVDAVLVLDERGGGFNGHAALLPPVLIR